MSPLIIFLLGIVIGLVIMRLMMRRKVGECASECGREVARAEKEKDDALNICAVEFGFDVFNRRMREEKEKRKAKIIEALSAQSIITTRKVSDLLDISRASAFRYLEELEQEKKIEQVGSFGREVNYRAIKSYLTLQT